LLQCHGKELAMAASARIRPLIVAALLASALAGCSTQSSIPDDSAARFFVAPDGFVLFNCEQLAAKAVALATREKELEELMAKAGTSSDGRLVSAFAYRPEYISLRGDMNEVRKAAAAKNCKSMPALENSFRRASDNAVR
jgi:hypothetical protein